MKLKMIINIQDHYIINENENNLLFKESKNNIKEDKNNIIFEEIENDIKKEDINKNFKIEEKEEYDINSIEYIKLKSVLLNSFTLEKINDKLENKEKKKKKKKNIIMILLLLINLNKNVMKWLIMNLKKGNVLKSINLKLN